jgi:lipoprotein NlpD
MSLTPHRLPGARSRFAAGSPRVLVVIATVLVAACSTPRNRAPVEDRRAAPVVAAAPAQTAASAPGSDPARLPPGSDNAGKVGYYTVKPGDTLIRIGLENGQNWRDIVSWNAIVNPDRIEVGQVLRVVPPEGSALAKPVVPGRIDARALPPGAAASAPPGAASAPLVAASAPLVAASAPPPVTVRDAEDDIGWVWPAGEPVVAGFDESKTKGLQIAGKAGDPVYAAADGRVVYAGSGLRGYGNLIIVKHNNIFLSAYAHNQTLLVKEDQPVRKGQKIAEMGSSDAESVQLHFEIRRQGKPVDPARLLPPR